MHMRGNPQNMQDNPSYQDPVKEIKIYLENIRQVAIDAGISAEKIIFAIQREIDSERWCWGKKKKYINAKNADLNLAIWMYPGTAPIALPAAGVRSIPVLLAKRMWL